LASSGFDFSRLEGKRGVGSQYKERQAGGCVERGVHGKATHHDVRSRSIKYDRTTFCRFSRIAGNKTALPGGGAGGAEGRGGGGGWCQWVCTPSRWVKRPHGVASAHPVGAPEPPKQNSSGQRMAENSGSTDGPPPVPKAPIRPGAAVLGRACASERPRCRCDFRLRV
jgi:hypothetical protein